MNGEGITGDTIRGLLAAYVDESAQHTDIHTVTITTSLQGGVDVLVEGCLIENSEVIDYTCTWKLPMHGG